MTDQVNRRVLVVDDSAVDRKLVTGLLQAQTSWQVEVAENGLAAMEIVREDPPDLVVTDLQMPEMDGLSLVHAIKGLYPNLPVILITAKGSEAAAMESLRGGATSYTPKTAIRQDLVRTARFVLELADHVVARPVINRADFQQRFMLANDCHLVMPLIEHLQNHMPSWTENCRLQMGMAIGEALVNAMHHGNLEVCSSLRTGDESPYHEAIRSRRTLKPFCDRRVTVEVEFNKNALKIRIGDEGVGYSPESVPDPTEPENVTKLCGRGLMLIRSFMDDVSLNDRGNEITMIKRRS